jgi:hypothetical protein
MGRVRSYDATGKLLYDSNTLAGLQHCCYVTPTVRHCCTTRRHSALGMSSPIDYELTLGAGATLERTQEAA